MKFRWFFNSSEYEEWKTERDFTQTGLRLDFTQTRQQGFFQPKRCEISNSGVNIFCKTGQSLKVKLDSPHRSELEFLPKSSKDYGSLFCIGENAIGRQEEACVFQVKNFPDFQISGFYPLLVFQIVPTGKPSPLTACQIVNKTLTSLKVQCQEGGKSLLPI